MRLRELQIKDAEYMLEWMHNKDVVCHLSANFADKTIEDCKNFIANSKNNAYDINLAIVNEDDEYMGTVSLKHVDKEHQTAEFAVTIRECAMGKGYSAYGMAEILRRGLEDFGLKNIYWCVSKNNERAVRFYDKNGYLRTTDIPTNILECYTKEQNAMFIWYVYS